MPAGRREEGCSSQQLEGHLRAILDPNAKERLVKDAMRIADGGRAAAIRQVLRDLDDEGKRLS
jgi:DNA-binding TFAR19-related protein (PDSD5 family)